MNRHLLSIMKGQRSDFLSQVIMYILVPFSYIYGLGVLCHRFYWRIKGVYRAPKPVISIGNISVGGAGKTPLVIWLARHLQDKGLKSIILIRGYMPKSKDAKDSDEVDMLNEQIPYIPVLAGRDRAANIRGAEDILPVDVYICDDAFQHWPLHRDLNIVAIDAGNPLGNGFLLPAGILREPVSALRRADVMILTKTDASNNAQALRARLQQINPHALIVESLYRSHGCVDVFGRQAEDEGFLKDKHVIGFCAIGDPLSFAMSLKNSGAKPVKLFSYMDHHIYKKSDMQSLIAACRANEVDVLVTTHKDAVKLKNFKELLGDVRLVYIPIQLEITKGSDEFLQKVLTVCRG